jgi:hypothetical protein
MTRLIALYPQTWRDRYEEEFLALLAERPPDPLDRVDIVRGAIDARLHPAPLEPQPSRVSDVPEGRLDNRRPGWLTLLGIPVWFAAVVVAVNGPIVTDSWGTYRDGTAAHPLAFIAIGLLLVGVGGGRRRPAVELAGTHRHRYRGPRGPAVGVHPVVLPGGGGPVRRPRDA